METLDLIADERRRLADIIEALTPEQARTPSLCAGWTVHDVGAHVLMPLETSRGRLFGEMAKAFGSFDKANLRLTARTAAKPDREIAAGLRTHARHPFHPPTMSHDAALTDLLIHGQDLRRPLGLAYRADDEKLRLALGFLTGPKAHMGFVPKGRTNGLRFEASDLTWTYGDGPPVRGFATALMLALTGRPLGFEDLHGDGVETLRTRIG